MPLLCGLLIYIFLKHGTYINVFFCYDSDIYLNGFFGKIIVSWATDFLWAYSLTFLLYALSKPWKKSIVFIVEMVFLIVMEVLQKFSIINGTFDIFDIFVEIFAMFIAICLCNYLYSQKCKKLQTKN